MKSSLLSIFFQILCFHQSYAVGMMTLTTTFFYFMMFLSIKEFSFAADMLSLGQSINDGQTLVSSSQSFELGFFSRGNSKYKFLGIWYKNIPKEVVWIANRNSPITDANGVLTINTDGNIALFDGKNSTVWASIISAKAENPVAQLLDSGNFVVWDNKSMQSDESYLWQSFDYPSDTLLQGMKIGKNFKTGKEWFLTPWRSADDPSPGNFTCRLNIQSLPSLIITMGSTKIYRTGLWDGSSFGGTRVSPNFLSLVTLVQNEDEMYYMYEPYNKPIVTRLILNPSGSLQRLIWNERSTEWETVFVAPPDECGQYNLCGANSICGINNNTPTCKCLTGFRVDSRGADTSAGWSKKCVKERPSDCQNGEGYFSKLVWMRLPDLIDFNFNKSMNLKECEVECSKNCSCSAYAIASLDEQGRGCLMWYGDLIDMKDQSGQIKGPDLYVRGSGGHASIDKKRVKIIIIISSISGIIILGLVLCLVLRKKLKRASGSNHASNDEKRIKITILLSIVPGLIVLAALLRYAMKKVWKKGKESWKESVEVHLFDLATIYAATNSFSQENLIGAGGFGSVYKGILPTGQEIAVKRMSNNSDQGVEELKNEVVLIAKLQHRNLVGLCGCCIEGKERLLIYEYMSNKSLDYFIFDQERRVLLGWSKRFDIIMQIVRGLLYLHQDSKLQIIHRDLKASNILLDSDMNPKISDFGLARIFEGDDRVPETKRVVGTFGYMSPEYAAKGKFSTKSDIFSLGVLILEFISGQKNRSFHHPDHHNNLLGHAWLLWNEGRAMELVDACLADSIVESQVRRCIQVGLLCVQNFSKDRPTMSSVNFMLANEEASLPHPKEPGFFTDTSSNADAATRKEELDTVNAVTITVLGGR